MKEASKSHINYTTEYAKKTGTDIVQYTLPVDFYSAWTCCLSSPIINFLEMEREGAVLDLHPNIIYL